MSCVSVCIRAEKPLRPGIGPMGKEGCAAFCTRRVAEAGEFLLYVSGRLLGVKVKHGEMVEQLLSWGAQWGNLSLDRC